MKRKTVAWILLGALASAGGAWGARAALTFNNTVTGEVLNLDDAVEEGRDTAAVKTFLDSGINSYNENPACLPKGEEIFLTACSGCHGHLGEGKIGPGLNDDYWTYPKNETDKGLFETIYGGAQGQMGPQYSVLPLDEMLLAMAWTRHLYKGDPKKAKWLTEEQRKVFKPYSADNKQPTDIAANGECG
ncbi:cytochrome c(L), periplasmic [Phyllobacterium phragmitis]|uniref:Cytochrome c-L n=1 Tax=Phyllobacterium phragmitis TaxID=2670329 RepID=A0A2S9IL62_9HYPH|nr:cytochrome c(L), periplasmic [Phyllobacterium phragmitis]PRD41276.1 cytochrome c(L), periplasmic [Phyllobacterium phragmitis]